MDSIHCTINQEADAKHRTIKAKLNQLSKTQTNNSDFQKQFYLRVVNKINITFTSDELSLLNKGLKYNLVYKHRDWIATFVLEATMTASQTYRMFSTPLTI